MQYALPQVLADVPAGGVCAGIDWATADHAACVVDMTGRVTDRFSAAHDKAGIAALISRLRRSKVTEVAIERGDGPLVDALLGAGLTVVVITSRQVKNLRSRYGAAGAKDDRFDAFVLADTLRTDRARLRPLVPDTPATISLRMAVRARRDLVRHRVAACNQLRAHLAVAFPAGITLFHDLDSPISLAFLARFGSQDAAAGLDEPAIVTWLATIAVRGRPAPASVLHARLHAAPPGATGADGAAQAGVTAALTATLTALSAQIKALETQIAGQLAAHPDAHIFTSLPRPGTVRAARQSPRSATAGPASPTPSRWPGWPGSRRSPAGPAPASPTASGGRSTASSATPFCDFAADSRHASPWAAAIYDDARARGKDHPLAVRITARAWTYVIWRCWHDGTAYDPAKHNALQAILARQQASDPAAAGLGPQETR